MKQHSLIFFSTIILLFTFLNNCKQAVKKERYLLSFTDTLTDEHGYLNQDGDTIIPIGKYAMCFTDTFRTYAIVLKDSLGFIAIDSMENVLYNVFPFDNGPDYVSEGMFRIVENNKIGFADWSTGKIIIKPKFDCAFPFEHGAAKVSTNCKIESEGEHGRWISEDWYYINKAGKKVDKPTF
jgi:hypothetical protein